MEIQSKRKDFLRVAFRFDLPKARTKGDLRKLWAAEVSRLWTILEEMHDRLREEGERLELRHDEWRTKGR